LIRNNTTMKILIKKNKNGKYFWVLVAGNGRTLATSESYSSKQACQDTVARVAKYADLLPVEHRY